MSGVTFQNKLDNPETVIKIITIIFKIIKISVRDERGYSLGRWITAKESSKAAGLLNRLSALFRGIHK